MRLAAARSAMREAATEPPDLFDMRMMITSFAQIGAQTQRDGMKRISADLIPSAP